MYALLIGPESHPAHTIINTQNSVVYQSSLSTHYDAIVTTYEHTAAAVLYWLCAQEAGATMTKLSTIPQHQLSITCGLCKHHTLLKVANLIAVVGGDTTAHEVRQRARCHNCGVKGNNTYQIVYTGNSSSRRLRLLDVAMDGAGVRSE